jgi:hypothetical protein
MTSLITVETDLFEHKTPQPHFINSCCFGEDFAVWLKDRLLPLADRDFVFSAPIQEDYGWGFWAVRRKDRFWVAISYVGNGPQDGPVRWVISVNYEPGLRLIDRWFHRSDRRQALEDLKKQVLAVLASSPAFKAIADPT